MQVTLFKNNYNTTSFKRNFISQQTLECVLKEGSDILKPELLIESSNPIGFNEMYIPDFKRYYFIGCENVSNNLWRIYSLGVDTLYTYKNEILALNAIIDKQENIHNDLIDDGSYVRQVDTFKEVLTYSKGFNDNETYVLITA